MQVEERVVRDALPTDPAWLATRQPAVMRYLALRCGDGTDALSVALHVACSVHGAYEAALGVPPPRVQSPLLARAERAVIVEAEFRRDDGVVQRQPALAEFVASVVACPPLPLDEQEGSTLGLALLAVIYALDEVATGRPVP